MALEGSLRDLSLIDLIKLFQIGVKTGVLWLIGGAEQGALYVRAGSLIDAVLMRGPARQVIATADDAVIRLLQWQDARFMFRPDARVHGHPARLVHDHDWLVQEAGRRRENAQPSAPEQAISLATCFALSRSPGGSAVAFTLDLVHWRILSQVPLSPNAGAIAACIGIAPEQALAGLARLLGFGLVEVVGC